jgi:hypothetical protein
MQNAFDARLSSRGVASAVIRVWTLRIIRSLPEQRQTGGAALLSWMRALCISAGGFHQQFSNSRSNF